MWHSKTDVGSSVFTLATSYDLVFKNHIRFKEDRERRKRFNQPRPLEDFSKPHSFSFSVWQRSLNLRYLIEAFLFLVLMIVFQIEITEINSGLRFSIDKSVEFMAIGMEIKSRGQFFFFEEGFVAPIDPPEAVPSSLFTEESIASLLASGNITAETASVLRAGLTAEVAPIAEQIGEEVPSLALIYEGIKRLEKDIEGEVPLSERTLESL